MRSQLISRLSYATASLGALLIFSACGSIEQDSPSTSTAESTQDSVSQSGRGEPCEGHADCPDGACLPLSDDRQICTLACTSEATCTEDWRCGPMDGLEGQFCQPPFEVTQCAVVDSDISEFSQGAMEGIGAGEAIAGVYLLGLRTDLDPTPILFRVTIAADGDELDLTFQPLLTDHFTDEESNTGDPRPNARQPTGSALEASATLAADGTFTYTFVDALIPGNANPTSGREFEFPTVAIESGACASWGFCGYVTEGTAIRPLAIPLRGYTVAAVPVDGRDLASIDLVSDCLELGDALGI